jgi:hypothetical protein
MLEETLYPLSHRRPESVVVTLDEDFDPLDFSSLRDHSATGYNTTVTGATQTKQGNNNAEPELGVWFVEDDDGDGDDDFVVEIGVVPPAKNSITKSCGPHPVSVPGVFSSSRKEDEGNGNETTTMGNCIGPNLGQRAKLNSLITFDTKQVEEENTQTCTFLPGTSTAPSQTKKMKSPTPTLHTPSSTKEMSASDRSAEAQMKISCRSAESIGGISTSSSRVEHSLRKWMTREQKDRDVYKYYEVLEVLGVGSMGSVSMVRKRKDLIGGSARLDVSGHGSGGNSSGVSVHANGNGNGYNHRSPNTRANRHSILHILGGGQSGSETSGLKQSNHEHEFDLGENSLEDVNDDGKHDVAANLFQDFTSMSTMSKHSIPSDRDYKMVYALKTIHLNRITDPKFLEELRNEIDVLKSLDHPNVVRAIETFEQRNQLCIVMELCSGGDLYTRDPYTEDQARRIIRKLTHCVAYMHRCGVVHRGKFKFLKAQLCTCSLSSLIVLPYQICIPLRFTFTDLKFENIMFESDRPDAEIKVLDFGLSKKYHPDNPHSE